MVGSIIWVIVVAGITFYFANRQELQTIVPEPVKEHVVEVPMYDPRWDM